ncbi:putative NADH dehydrogenase (ubiquinone), 30 kDa subunit [Magnetofaba australis IT-1]|uniref:Putative NADH dehydrogenase (Ubiquinone), 30 kDa subunit n=2 Tax=Magnetofaba TaxID=1472292 RepID=A0A1Y2K3U2_9PROT|nr:putative NADH dehydrogenase (ubiquinone), 30 kDa subunit [Magnetofaba australis IT-1]
MAMDAILKNLSARCALGELDKRRADLWFVTVDPAHVRPALAHLRDNEGFTHLVLLTAVDWMEEGRFQLTYLLHNRAAALDVGLRCFIDRETATMESIHDMWATAATYQRELKEMFGIDFPGSPGVDDEFILEGWAEIPPYRRDFDTLAYAEATYTNRPGRASEDPEEYMQRKLYPEGA